jgi:hypothetical protein
MLELGLPARSYLTEPNETPNRLRRIAEAIGDLVLGFFVALGFLGALLTLLMLVREAHSAVPGIKNAIGEEGGLYLGVGVAVTAVLVLFVSSHRVIRAFRRLIGGTGLLLLASALIFLFDLNYPSAPSGHHSSRSTLKAESSPPPHPDHGLLRKGKPSNGSGSSSTKPRAPVYVASTHPTNLAHSASRQSGTSAGCGCGSPLAYYSKEESASKSPGASEAEQPPSEHETSTTKTAPSTSPETSSTPSASAATTPTSAPPSTETGTTSTPTGGEYDTGVGDTGTHDTGDYDSGSYDIGDYDIGSNDSGDHDTGNYDTGDNDSGEHDSGDNDTGNYETGDDE